MKNKYFFLLFLTVKCIYSQTFFTVPQNVWKFSVTEIYGNEKWAFASLKINNYPLKCNHLKLVFKYDIKRTIFITDCFNDSSKISVGYFAF